MITIYRENEKILEVETLAELKQLVSDPNKNPKHLWKLKHKIRDGLLENISTAVRMAEYLSKMGYTIDVN